MKGYATEEYARSLSEFGVPLKLPRSGGWLLKRTIPQSALQDAMGCYPLFSCCEWNALFQDLEEVGGGLVSVALVVDPFTTLQEKELAGYFDRVFAYKKHLLVNLGPSPESFIGSHHRYYARRALKDVQITVAEPTVIILDNWNELYKNLINRHQLTGIKAFSEASFSKQFLTPGLVVLQAMYGGRVVGAHLWYVQGDVAYSHLAATSDVGYKLSVSYALYWEAIHYFRKMGLSWLDIGSGAGNESLTGSGLSRFKQGWSNADRTVFFCGKIFDRKAYEELNRVSGKIDTSYFPGYRLGEFT